MLSMIPDSIVYAGLVGTLLALFVATATNNWKPRVFFLLALRLAIGWQFLFEGLNKLNSHLLGPTETNRPFTSEPYFAAGEGPLADVMRKKYIGDPDAVIAEKATPQADRLAGFAKLSAKDQAALCPKAIAEALDKAAEEGFPKAQKDVDAIRAELPKLKAAAKVDEKKAEADAARALIAPAEAAAAEAEAAYELAKARALVARADAGKIKETESTGTLTVKGSTLNPTEAHKLAVDLRATANQLKYDAEFKEKATAEAKKKADDADKKLQTALDKVADLKEGIALKMSYARWLYGVDRRDAKVKHVGSDVPESVPDRLAQIELLKATLEEFNSRSHVGLGNGNGTDMKRMAAARKDLLTAKTELASDAEAYVAALASYANPKTEDELKAEPPVVKPIASLDQLTIWTITLVGVGLLFGFCTPVACLVGAGFLIMTYLAHPTVPWLPLPPGTEGNPLFINKNLIEVFALLALMCFPTGRWLGLDALIARFLFGKRVVPA